MQNHEHHHSYQTVAVATLGYFVDIFDLWLFGVLRVVSLKDLGVPEDRLLEVGVGLLNYQMTGILIGGLIWGILGDRRGRLSVLFGSILLYSVANIANAYVQSVEWYGLLRFFAGVGLAGELGAAVTLVSEILPAEKRGYGTTIIASVGLCGSVAASVVAEYCPWRTAYMIGGVLGLFLLFLRFGLRESGLFQAAKERNVARGRFLMLFTERSRLSRYLCLIGIGIPVWFTSGIVITFAPEFGRSIGISAPIAAGKAIFYYYIGAAIGDLASGLGSQLSRNRRKVIWVFLFQLLIFLLLYLFPVSKSPFWFYSTCGLLGFATGYWAVLMTAAAEQFGTNLRSTVTTTVPNFVRGSVVPITALFQFFKGKFGLIDSALIVGLLCFALAGFALSTLTESFGKDLNYLETI